MQSSKSFFQLLITAIAAVSILSIWFWVAIPESNKLDEHYSLHIEYAAQTTMVDDVYGDLKGPYYQIDVLSERVIGKEGNVLSIESSVTGKRVGSGEVMFHVEDVYNVDAKTLMHVDKPGKRWGFLPGVEKKDYDFFHPAVFYDDPMIFKKTDYIHGLETYVFEVVTKRADTSRAFPQFAPHKIFTDTTSRLWIEPITGQLIKFEKSWDNYLVENGQRVNTIQMGGKNTTEFTELILTEFAKAKIETFRFQNYAVPIFILIAVLSSGTIWILWSYLGTVKKESEKQEKMAIIGNTSATIAHNIRNPLNIIGMSLYLLKNKELSPEKKIEYIDTAQNGVNTISYHINSMLNFVREPSLVIEKTTVNKILQSSLNEIIIPKGIKLETKVPDIILYADVKQLETVFTNLIMNAIQAIKIGTVSVIAKETSDSIQIDFVDSGPGIPENKKDKIFEPLYTTKQIGTGLGLASCKKIVENHGGKISVENNPTRFIITIPKSNRVLNNNHSK